jgi:hypothetical protein
MCALQTLNGQGLRWLGAEGESGLAEESGDEARLPLDAVQLAPHGGGELADEPGARLPRLFFITDQAPFSWFVTVHGSLRKQM